MRATIPIVFWASFVPWLKAMECRGAHLGLPEDPRHEGAPDPLEEAMISTISKSP